MMRAVGYLLLIALLLSGCVSSDDEGTTAKEHGGFVTSYADAADSYLVVEFFFYDVAPGVDGNVRVGPMRLLGVDDACTCSLLLSPYSSLYNSYNGLGFGGGVNESVALYSHKIGFMPEHSPCWRYCVMTDNVISTDKLILEVNYSYFYDKGDNRGFVSGMQRLPLYNSDGSGFIRLDSDGVLPFSVAYLCFHVSPQRFVKI